MSLELEDMRAAVDKMSDEELAQVAIRMMAVSLALKLMWLCRLCRDARQ